MKINNAGHLEIGGMDVTDIVKDFPTPVYVMDEAHIRNIMKGFKSTIESIYGDAVVAFASKAFSAQAIYRIAQSEGIYADVVSLGEIMTAVSAGFKPENMFFHGNNKQIYEISAAVELGVGTFCIDSFDEIDTLDKIAGNKGIKQKVLVRTNPGIDAHTHKFIQTATTDSKFGFSVSDGTAERAIQNILQKQNLDFMGLNCHIGSQIFDKKGFGLAAEVMTDFIKKLSLCDITVNELSLGGGFGVYYTEEDPKFSVQEYCDYVRFIAEKVLSAVELKGIKKPRLVVEPGRSVVAEAGITLYEAGTIKEIIGIKKYIAVNGGMTDNIRPGLYGAKYEAIIANKANEPEEEKVSIAGRCCESDILIEGIMLPKVCKGDIIAVFSTGAYNYSMASNYNKIPRPGVLLVRDGKAEYIVRPETVADMYRNDEIPSWL